MVSHGPKGIEPEKATDERQALWHETAGSGPKVCAKFQPFWP